MYEQKLLVWVAISPIGMSKQHIVPSGQVVKETVYIEKCLRARLVPYINSLQNNDVIFWPDFNSVNAPEVRPIEDFWTKIKRIVYDGG